MDTRVKNLLPKGDYYEKTSPNFKKNIQMASEHCSSHIKTIQDQAQILSDTMMIRWQKLLETRDKEEALASLSWQGGNSLEYITKCAKSFSKDIEVEVKDIYTVHIKNVTHNPIIFGGSFKAEKPKEVRFLNKIKPAYIIFKYFNKKGWGVYNEI